MITLIIMGVLAYLMYEFGNAKEIDDENMEL